MTGAVQPASTTARGPVAFVPHRIPVDHGIPIPPRKPVRRSGHYGPYVKYPWRAMQVGDSFAVPVDIDGVREQAKVIGVMRAQHRRNPGVRYTSRVRVEKDGDKEQLVIRIWREV